MRQIDELTRQFRSLSKGRKTGVLTMSSGFLAYFQTGKLAYCIGDASVARLSARTGKVIEKLEELFPLSEQDQLALSAETSFCLVELSQLSELHCAFEPSIETLEYEVELTSPLAVLLDTVEFQEFLPDSSELKDLLQSERIFHFEEGYGCREPLAMNQLLDTSCLNPLELVKKLQKGLQEGTLKEFQPEPEPVDSPLVEEVIEVKEESPDVVKAMGALALVAAFPICACATFYFFVLGKFLYGQ